MSDHPSKHTDDEPRSEPDWKRKQRLAEIFGDVLPDQTSDDTTAGDPADRAERAEASDRRESASDRWLKSQVPPHHG